MITLAFALVFWTLIALWLLSWTLPFIVGALRLVVELTLWAALVVCGLALASVENVQAMGSRFARARRRRPVHISRFDIA